MHVDPNQPSLTSRGSPRATRVSYRGTARDPHAVREAVFAEAFAAHTGRPAEEFHADHQHVQVPDDIDWQDPAQVAALHAQAQPQHKVRMTYPVVACTCPARPIAHTFTSLCPPPIPDQVEESRDGGQTWQPVP